MSSVDPRERPEPDPTPPPGRRICPVCGGVLEEIWGRLQCARCHTICETCCEGGREEEDD